MLDSVTSDSLGLWHVSASRPWPWVIFSISIVSILSHVLFVFGFSSCIQEERRKRPWRCVLTQVAQLFFLIFGFYIINGKVLEILVFLFKITFICHFVGVGLYYGIGSQWTTCKSWSLLFPFSVWAQRSNSAWWQTSPAAEPSHQPEDAVFLCFLLIL